MRRATHSDAHANAHTTPVTRRESPPAGTGNNAQVVVPLSDFDGSRRNNFTSIRILLAWSVLYGHSFAIAKLPGVSDPLNRVFQGSIYIGDIAVNGFFALSGFLVCASFIKRGFADYTLSRALRIFPALITCVALATLVMGPLVTSLSVREYFADAGTWNYLRNGLAFFRMHWNLPGVFEDNVRQAVNGSLWTLTVEVRCYVLLAVIGLFGLLRDRHIGTFAMLCLFAFALFYFEDIPLVGVWDKWARPAGYFLIGVFLYLNRDRVILDSRLALFAAVLCAAAFGKPWFDYVFAPAFVYLLFYLAYGTPYLDTDSKLGDISYGVYIYAWPVQQLVVQAWPGMHPYANTLISSAFVIPMAWLSWHYLERPMLSLKGKLLRKG
jgi:peptidoglycan/LPS O-acetylase OafA/YrhL